MIYSGIAKIGFAVYKENLFLLKTIESQPVKTIYIGNYNPGENLSIFKTERSISFKSTTFPLIGPQSNL